MRFPNPGDERLSQGVSRNFQVFEPLEFLAEVAQHIPNKGQHLIRYVGWYSNKKRGVRQKNKVAAEGKQDIGSEDGNGLLKQCHMSWAALIKKVYEADPLRCPACGGAMQVISLIDKCQPEAVKRILRHCGLWKTAESATASEKYSCRTRALLRLWLPCPRLHINSPSMIVLLPDSAISPGCLLFLKFT